MIRNGYIIACSCAALLWQCANPVTPTGGSKDITPPKIVLTTPTERSIGLKPKTVVFKFDENITVSNAKEQIIVSPALKTKPAYKTGNNYIKIEFTENSLSENTTYSVQLNECVKDLNEGNQGTYKPFLFSTGKTLDTFNVEGKCLFVEEPKTQKVKIKTVGPNPYIGLLNKSMRFYIPGLPQDSLWVVAFNDLNGDNQWNKGEAAGVSYTSTQDSAIVLLYNTGPQKIGLIKYSKERFGYYGSNLPPPYGREIINYKDTFIGDSASVFYFILSLDTNNYIVSKKPENKKDILSYHWKKPAFLKDSFQEIHLIGNKSILTPTEKTIDYLSKDKNFLKAEIKTEQNNIIQIVFGNNQTGSIRIPFQFMTTDGKEIKDTFKTNIPVYTSLNITNKETIEIYIHITNKNTGEKHTGYILPNEKIRLWVLSGDHDVFYYKDANRNKILDGPVINDVQPSYGEYYKKLPVLKIKENMGVDLDIKASEKP